MRLRDKIYHAMECGRHAAKNGRYPPMTSVYEQRHFQIAWLLGYDWECVWQQIENINEAVAELCKKMERAGDA